MAIYILADTHLSLSVDKPMDVFGFAWENYMERLASSWKELVKDEDIVILPGDISWGLKAEEAIADLRFLDSLPGHRKILLRGNHDYWWTTRKRVEDLFAENDLRTLSIFQNEALLLEDEGLRILLVGTRGWKNPLDDDFRLDDEKVYRRELERLRLSLKQGEKLEAALAKDGRSVDKKLAVTHYPPVQRDGRLNAFGEMMADFAVDLACYGHIHGMASHLGFEGCVGNLVFWKVSADYLRFVPRLVEWEALGLPDESL